MICSTTCVSRSVTPEVPGWLFFFTDQEVFLSYKLAIVHQPPLRLMARNM